MSSAIHLAGPDDIARVLSLMARYHEEAGLDYDETHRTAVAAPLLEGSPLGAIWLIGPARAPLGYIMVTFGWSVPLGGMVGWLAEAFIRPSVRNRGIGTEAVHAVTVSLRAAGLRAMHAHVDGTDSRAGRFCARTGFATAEGVIMTDPL